MDSLYAVPTHKAGSHYTLPLYILELRFSAALAPSALHRAIRVLHCVARVSLHRAVCVNYCRHIALRKGRFSASLLTRSGVKRPLFFWSWGPPPPAKRRCFSASLLTRNVVKRPLFWSLFENTPGVGVLRCWLPPLAVAVGYCPWLSLSAAVNVFRFHARELFYVLTLISIRTVCILHIQWFSVCDPTYIRFPLSFSVCRESRGYGVLNMLSYHDMLVSAVSRY